MAACLGGPLMELTANPSLSPWDGLASPVIAPSNVLRPALKC